MTPTEMETLADMIAARLMGTFAARLDMIEDVVFSGVECDAPKPTISSYDDIKEIILNRIRMENSITGLKIHQDKSIRVITGWDVGFYVDDGPRREKQFERNKLIESIIAEMVNDGSISAHKTSEHCTRYYDGRVTGKDAVMCLLRAEKFTCPSAVANKAKNHYPFRLLGEESYQVASKTISQLIDSGDVVNHWMSGLKPSKILTPMDTF